MYIYIYIQVNLDMTDSMGPGKKCNCSLPVKLLSLTNSLLIENLYTFRFSFSSLFSAILRIKRDQW